jgi:uncharacterized protein (TIGR00369 family)
MNGLQFVEALASGALPPPPIGELVGMRLVSASAGEARFEMDADKRHHNPMGTLHGGILCDLGDGAMGCAVATTMEEGQTYTTIELKVNFFKPVWEQHLTARGKVVKRTRKLVYAEAEVTDEAGSLVAKLACTCLVLDGTDAKGR